MSIGAVYIVFGQRAAMAAAQSIASLRAYNKIPIRIISDTEHPIPGTKSILVDRHGERDNVRMSRLCKTQLDRLSPFSKTLYLDADTMIRGSIMAGFGIIDGGYDVAVAPSANQGRDILEHIGEEERALTVHSLFGAAVQLQCGVMFFGRNEAVAELFWSWRCQWQIWREQDQAAFLRALHKWPVRVWLLGRSWNGGALIEHRFGSARA